MDISSPAQESQHTNLGEGKAVTRKSTFHRETTVSMGIKANAPVVWSLLTQAADYPRWNSTIVSIEGRIAPGETIRLKSTLDAKRTFKLRVKEFDAERRLVWGDGQGNRVYTLSAAENGAIKFSMTERIGGLMFPLYASMIPSFDQSFEQFAGDLKREAERIMNARR